MELSVSSDVSVDLAIMHTMTQPEPTPFKDLLEQAQQALDRLSQSIFFRRFISEKLDEIRLTKVLRIARSGRGPNSEWLVLTPEFKLRFMRREGDSDTIYDYGEKPHDDFLLKKSSLRLEQMGMQFLTTRFGEPSFTVEDIQAELTRNGKIRVIGVRSHDSDEPSYEDNLELRLGELQFDVSVQSIDYKDPLPLPAEGNYIILLDVAPIYSAEAEEFFSRLTAEQKRRLWTTKLDHNADGYYRRHGYSQELLLFPGYIYCYELPDTELLGMLSNMFADPM